MNTQTPMQKYHEDMKRNKKEFKIVLVVLTLALSFYFINKPVSDSQLIGTIKMCSNSGLSVGGGRFTKKLTITHKSGQLNLPYYKCDTGQKVQVIIQKRLITRQNVYTISYI